MPITSWAGNGKDYDRSVRRATLNCYGNSMVLYSDSKDESVSLEWKKSFSIDEYKTVWNIRKSKSWCNHLIRPKILNRRAISLSFESSTRRCQSPSLENFFLIDWFSVCASFFTSLRVIFIIPSTQSDIWYLFLLSRPSCAAWLLFHSRFKSFQRVSFHLARWL